MPRGYVQNPMEAPTDPRFYDSLAGGMREGILEGVTDVAKGAFSYVQNKSAEKSKKQMALELTQALIDNGMTPAEAKASTIQYINDGNFNALNQFSDMKVVAAKIAASKAETAQSEAMTREIAPNAEASRANLGASTAMTQAQTADIPADTEIARMGAETSRMQTQGDLGIRRSELDAKIDKETRDFAAKFDTDQSGTIDGDEYEKLFTANRARVRSKAETDATPISEDEVYAQAKKETDAIVSDYATLRTDKPWTKIKLRGGVQPPAPQPTGGGTIANTYEEAVALIERMITDPAQKARALQDAKAQFGR